MISNSNCVVNEGKRKKISKYPNLEDATSSWFKKASVFQNIIIDRPTNLQQWEKYENFLGYQESGWLDGFKKIKNIKFKSTFGDAC